MLLRAACAALLFLAGCGSEGAGPAGGAAAPDAAGCVAGEIELTSGGCAPAGTQPNGCAAGSVPDPSGACAPAGVAACADGFASDGDRGCAAVLPSGACAAGSMAIPGETACHEIAPCGSGIWGDIARGPDTEHVDGSYAGGGSDGSMAKPWTTIQAAVDAAAGGATVAVAEGSYAEMVLVSGKSVRLIGRCPGLVEITGDGSFASVRVEGSAASGSEVKGLAVTGAGAGIATSGAEDVVLEALWIHDTGARGIAAESALGPTRVSVGHSLIEHAREIGVYISGAEATLEALAVRDTAPQAGDSTAWGIGIQNKAKPAEVTLRASVIERNQELGVAVFGSNVLVETTVVRATDPPPLGDLGRGINVQPGTGAGGRSSLTLRSSVIDDSADAGLYVVGSDATVESTSITATRTSAGDKAGWGLYAQTDAASGERAVVNVVTSIVRGSHDAGVIVFGSDVRLEATVVTDTLPSGDGFGRGVAVYYQPETSARGHVTLIGSVVERSHDHGVFVTGSDATIEGSVVSDTQTSADGSLGRGLQVQLRPQTKEEHGSLELRWSVIEKSHDLGVAVVGSDAMIEGTVVREVLQANGLAGDGIAVISELGQASAIVFRSIVDTSARSGIASFGAGARLGETRLECNPIDLDGETFLASPASFEDLGGNLCGCGEERRPCAQQSASLTPPKGIDDAP